MRETDLAQAPRIGVGEAKELLNHHRAIFVDVRSEAQYRSGHIVGAVPLPLASVAAEGETLPRDKPIVAY